MNDRSNYNATVGTMVRPVYQLVNPIRQKQQPERMPHQLVWINRNPCSRRPHTRPPLDSRRTVEGRWRLSFWKVGYASSECDFPNLGTKQKEHYVVEQSSTASSRTSKASNDRTGMLRGGFTISLFVPPRGTCAGMSFPSPRR